MIDVTEHMGLAQFVVKSFYPKYSYKYEYEDILQIAYLALVKAANGFNENLGYKFSTFATNSMFRALYNFAQRDRRFNKKIGVAVEQPVLSYESEYENGCLANQIGSNNFEDNLLSKIELQEITEKLSDQEKKIFELYFINDLKQSEIAQIININQNQVSRVKRRVIRKMKSAYAEKVIM